MPPVQGSFGCRPTPLGQSLARPRGFGRRLDARPRVGERGRGRVLQLFFSRAWARAAESAAKLWPAWVWARVGGDSNQMDP
uniref:Uncharacterized protein n=1 Tax=Arundo donax TaxID=35708 RepID=A0A0A9EQ08_ARUDO